MKKISIIFLCNILFFSTMLGQTAATATWALTSNQTATVSGSVTASAQTLSNMQITYSSSVQRSSPTGTAGTWVAESGENSTRYIQFAVAPISGNSLTVSSISMILYANSGSGMRANVYYSTDSTFTSKTQIGSTYTLGNSALTNANVTAAPALTVNSGSTLYVRVYPWEISATTSKYLIANSVIVSGTTQSMVAVIPSTNELTGFTQSSSSTPSSSQSYKVSGNNLTNNVVITPPAGFQISADGGSTWIDSTSSITLNVSSGSIVSQPVTVNVRLNASVAGGYAGAIVHTSTGASIANVFVNGALLAAEPTTVSVVSFDTITGNSMTINFSSGNGSDRIVVVRPDNPVSWTPTDGALVTGTNNIFTTALDQGNGNRAVYDGTGSSVTVTGLTANKTYYVAVYEYNQVAGAAQNYLTSSAGTGSNITLAVPTLSVSTPSLSFGNVLVNNTSATLSFTVAGMYLNPVNGNITVNAPTGFAVSTSSGSGYASSVVIPYSGNTLSATRVYAQFTPTSLTSYSDIVSGTGGDAPAVTVAVAGTGVSQIIQTTTPVGYASCGTGTTGGAGGDTTIITDVATLYSIITARQKNVTTPVVLLIKGKLDGSSESAEVELKYQANVSILGMGDDAACYGFGFKVWNANNIIFRNISFQNCTAGEGDAISIETCNQVWVDHCSFTDAPGDSTEGSGGHDGLTDIKKGSTNVTVSFNKYQDHRKTSLLGYSTSDNADTATGVTYYMNWFQGTYSRHPRVRYAHPHVLNNYFDHAGTWGADSGGYAEGATCGCNIYSEGNYFEHVRTPFLISGFNDPSGVLSHDPVGYIKSVNDYFVNCFGTITTNDTNTTSFILPSKYYSYAAVDPATVRETVRANAGVGHISIGTLITSVGKSNTETPALFHLNQNYPNPFNPSTKISFVLSKSGFTTLAIYNILGEKVATLLKQELSAGEQFVTFDASRLASGVYFYKLQSGNFSEMKKMVLMK
jgi:pectate lyase